MASISVLISVYKEDNPAYFERALKSIWDDQILKPSEIILIEDGLLTPPLYGVIDTFQRRVGDVLKIIKNEPNLGLTKSLNKGIDIATGEYIARMDSDDVSLPERFLLQTNFLSAHPEVMAVGGGMLEINENDSTGALRLYPQTMDKITNYIVKANPLPHPTVMFNSKLFQSGVRYDERFRKNQDLKLWFDLISAGVVLANIPDVVHKFRRTEDTYKRRASRASLTSEYKIYDEGIRQMHGRWSAKRIYPLIRYGVKSMPPGIVKFTYKYLFRKKG